MPKWGAKKWGTFKWGGGAALLSTQQGYYADAKQDTVFLGKLTGAVGTLATDRSQYRTNITDNTTYVAEASSARASITYPRTIQLRFSAVSGSSGTLISHGNPAGGINDNTYRVHVTGGNVELSQGATLLATVALPGLSATSQEYALLWMTEADPTAVSVCRSVIRVAKISGGESYDGTDVGHAASTTDAGWTLAIKASHLATLVYSDSVLVAYVGAGVHSPAEWAEDFVGASTSPTITSDTRRTLLMPTRASGMGDDGNFAGPVHSAAAGAVHELDMRLVSAAVSEAWRTSDIVANTASIAPTEFARAAPGATTYLMDAATLRVIWPPVTCNRLYVTMWIATTYLPGGPTACKWRWYVMTRLPVQNQIVLDKPEPLDWRYGEATTTTEMGSTPQRVQVGPIPIVRASNGTALLVLSLESNGGARDGNLVWRLHAVTAEYCYVDPGQGGMIDDLLLPP